MCLDCVNEVGTTQASLSPTLRHPCFHPLFRRIPVPGDPGTRRSCGRLRQSFMVSLCRGPGSSHHVEKVKTCISFPSLRPVGLGFWDTESKSMGGENIPSSSFLVGVNSRGSHTDPSLLSAQGAAQAPPLWCKISAGRVSCGFRSHRCAWGSPSMCTTSPSSSHYPLLHGADTL